MGSIEKRWTFKDVPKSMVEQASLHSGLPEPLARALALRGHAAEQQVADFLNPLLANLSDSFLLPDMTKAVERIWQAIDAAERITVFGDYDVDGITAAAIMTRVLTVLGADVKPFIPDRIDEGYGLSLDALQRCLELHNSSLLVSVDCGVNSVESIAYAQANGVDVIVTDHHEPDAQTAEAFALINPKLGSEASLEILSGAGVAFKLSHGLVKEGRAQERKVAEEIDLRDYLDIAALGTVADIVPLRGENRIMVRHGLKKLYMTKWEGMRALKDVAGIRGEVDTYHLGFQLGPRINAAGRIGQPMQALQLLTTDDPAEAREIAALLDKTNQERRKIEQQMADEAFAEIDAYFDPATHFGLMVAREGWHPGVVGIVASRVSRHYNRPAIVLGIDEDGRARGSCRSAADFDLLEGLRRSDHLLTKYGGHKMAAGVELPADALSAFKAGFNAAGAEALEGEDLSPVQMIDAVLPADVVDWRFFESLQKLGPFGQDNPEPVWALMGAKLSALPRVVGQKHLKLSLTSMGRRFEAIAFNYPLEQLPDGALDVAFTLKENNWNGNTSIQLQVQDIRAAERKPQSYPAHLSQAH